MTVPTDPAGQRRLDEALALLAQVRRDQEQASARLDALEQADDGLAQILAELTEIRVRLLPLAPPPPLRLVDEPAARDDQ